LLFFRDFTGKERHSEINKMLWARYLAVLCRWNGAKAPDAALELAAEVVTIEESTS